MADKTKVKEVGADGLPIQRLGGWLIGDLHQYFTDDMDRLLRLGWLNEEEYVALVAATNAALDAFRAGLPESVAGRAYGDSAYQAAMQAKIDAAAQAGAPSPAQPMMMMEKENGAMGALTDWLGGFVGKVNEILNKETFDESSWDGSASNYKNAAAYCAACLIDANPAGATKVESKCHLPVRKPGSKAINKNALKALAGGHGIGQLKGVSPADKAKAAKFAISHWQAAFGKPAPAAMYEMAGMKMPMKAKSDDSAVRFFQDKSGEWWMLGIYSNHWKDYHGEILSEAAHQEYADWINKSGFQPAVTLAHMPRLSEKFWKNAFRKFANDIPGFNALIGEIYKDFGFARVQRIIPMNGFALELAKVNPDKKELAANLAKLKNLGMSHGCMSMKELIDFNLDTTPVTIVDKYRSFEMTVLPREKAANAATIPIFVEARAMAKSINDTDRDFLVQAGMPEDLIDNVDEITATIEKQLNERLAFKDDAPPEGDTEKPKEEEVAPVVDEPAAEPVSAPVATGAEELVAEVMKALNVDGLRTALVSLDTKLTALEGKLGELESLKVQVKELAKTEDEKIAAKIVAPVKPGIDWGVSASQSDETIIKDKEAEKRMKEKIGDPKLAADMPQLDKNNPMHAMVYGPLLSGRDQ